MSRRDPIYHCPLSHADPGMKNENSKIYAFMYIFIVQKSHLHVVELHFNFITLTKLI